VEELAIGNFPGNGIEMTGGGYIEVYRSWLGVDPTGVRAAPNGLRGIQVDSTAADIIDNVLSGNRRAGGFFVTNEYRTQRVLNNRVGVGADGTTPLGNGASGLFFHKSDFGLAAAEVRGNVVAHNAHAGIGLSLAANGDFGSNSFRANAGQAIDVALDGPLTREMQEGLPGRGGVIGPPSITSATFANGATVVSGRIATSPQPYMFSVRVYVYADGELVATVTRPNDDGTFTATIPRDLRGRAMRASTFSSFVYDWDFVAQSNSELSDPVTVP
jgi:hypothetical protein